jgi:transcriptional regulator with XRE-family HTH domain
MQTDDYAAIAGRLRHIMEALGDSQVRFAKRTGVSQQGLNNWLQARQRPGLNQAIKICQRTGATLDYIYLGDVSGLPDRLLPPAV